MIRSITIVALVALAACSSDRDQPRNATRDARSHAARDQIRSAHAEDRAAGREVTTGSPDRAAEWRALRLRDERGVIDPAGHARALDQRAANAAHHAAIDDAGIGRFGWVERGPTNLAGRARSLVIDTLDPDRIWVGSVSGGIWYSSDGGATWAPVDDRLGNLAICCLALVPGLPVTIYAGTGEGFGNIDARRGLGIYKSIDGGATFAQLPATSIWGYVNRIAVSPLNSQIVLAATRAPGGIWRSTDGGTSWALVQPATDRCLDVDFDPNDANRCVAHVRDGATHRVVRSTDAGATWTDAASGLVAVAGRIELAYARNTQDLVYANCEAGGGQIWRSTDGGANWTLRTAAGSSTGADWYYAGLWVDPTNANVLVCGSIHIHRSIDGGATFTQISNGYIDTTDPHPDNHDFVEPPGFDGVNVKRLYVVNDGGVFRTDDVYAAARYSGWTRLDGGLRTLQFYGAAGDGLTGRITGGTQDNGHLTIDPNIPMTLLTSGGDGGFAAIDWQAPWFLYGEYIYAKVHRSADGGFTASYIHTGIAGAGTRGAANFIAPMVMDPNDPRRLLVGGSSLWRTNDARAATVSWSSIRAADPLADLISAVAVAPGNPDVIWVGHNYGRIYMTSDGTSASPSWTAVDDNGANNPLPNRYVTRILIDQGDNDWVYVAFGGYSSDNLYRTTNAGTSFRNLTGSGVTGLPDAPVYGIAQHPTLLDHLYVGTDVGVFATANDGNDWSTSNQGPSDVSVDEVAFLRGSTTLLAATHGRGLWTIEIREPAVFWLGAGCPGFLGVPVLTATYPRLGENLTLRCGNLGLGQPGWIVLGVSNTLWNNIPLPLDLSGIGMPNCRAYCSVDIPIGSTSFAGQLTLSFTTPAILALLGGTVYTQAYVYEPGANPAGLVVSNALALVVGN